MLKNFLCIIGYLPEFDGIESADFFLNFFLLKFGWLENPKPPFSNLKKIVTRNAESMAP